MCFKNIKPLTTKMVLILNYQKKTVYLLTGLSLCLIFTLFLNIPMINLHENQNSEQISNQRQKTPINAYTDHFTITIKNNTDFDTQANNEGWSGDGTSISPYIIENYSITTYLDWAMVITNTSRHFIVRN